MNRKKKFGLLTIGILIVGFVIYFSIHFLYVYGDGVKAGQLNYVVRKGYIFKTYEGKLIQSGLQSKTGVIGSNEFEFSVSDKAIAEELMRAGGRYVELRYKEYFGALPWRGYSRYVVDGILNIKDVNTPLEIKTEPEPINTNIVPE